MQIKKNPCNPDCPKRNATCHAKCPEYAEFRQYKDELNKKIYDQKEAEYAEYCRHIQATKEKRKHRSRGEI